MSQEIDSDQNQREVVTATSNKSTNLQKSPVNRPTFAHPAEATFAQILDFYGIEWEYEPRTFDLEWDEAGNVLSAFAPDFYLPGQDLYIELTTLRPKFSHLKNRKLHRLQELYPHVNIKLFKRRDLRDLLTKYGHDREAAHLTGTEAQNWNA